MDRPFEFHDLPRAPQSARCVILRQTRRPIPLGRWKAEDCKKKNRSGSSRSANDHLNFLLSSRLMDGMNRRRFPPNLSIAYVATFSAYSAKCRADVAPNFLLLGFTWLGFPTR